MVTNPGALTPLLLEFPVMQELDDAKRIFAEYAILGGMLKAEERFIREGANTDWTHPMSEAIARACVEAWERHGADSNEAWHCNCSAYLMRYAGRSPLVDQDMYAWITYLMGIYRMAFPEQEAEEQGAE